jgi:hypothetical protein
MNLAIKDIFGGGSYGDAHRLPLDYVATHTQQAPIKSRLPSDISMHSKARYQQFPQLSKELLVRLFCEIGVKYVPEVALYQLQERRPIEIFQEFVTSFGISVEDRVNKREIIDTDILNLVILSLKKMDALREVYPFDSKPIYKLLAQQEFEKVETLIMELKGNALRLRKLLSQHKDELRQREIKMVFIESWHKLKPISNLIKRIKND